MPDKAVPLFERLLQALSHHGRYVPEAGSDAPFPNSRGGEVLKPSAPYCLSATLTAA